MGQEVPACRMALRENTPAVYWRGSAPTSVSAATLRSPATRTAMIIDSTKQNGIAADKRRDGGDDHPHEQRAELFCTPRTPDADDARDEHDDVGSCQHAYDNTQPLDDPFHQECGVACGDSQGIKRLHLVGIEHQLIRHLVAHIRVVHHGDDKSEKRKQSAQKQDTKQRNDDNRDAEPSDQSRVRCLHGATSCSVDSDGEAIVACATCKIVSEDRDSTTSAD